MLHAAILALTVPMYAFSLGLGKMTVKSALDQPFLAEIELVDVRSVALSDIKVNIADPANFKQMGIEAKPALSLLSFTIAKNEQGKEVIKVQSIERMSDPYMELVIDLTWSQGQLYKAYTILLDPPGYQLVSSTIQGSPTYYKHVSSERAEPGAIDKTVVTSVTHNPIRVKDSKQKASYGPTVTNENVWQIAQRYKTSEVILPQVVLAIVGANPDAFKDGNLNGLKVGMRLLIPATSEITKVPAELATAEAMAHDKAWNDKTPIEHVILPPYTSGQATEKNNSSTPNTSSPVSSGTSKVVPIATTPVQEPIQTPSNSPQIITNYINNSLGNTKQQTTQNQNPQSRENDATTKAELSVAVAAVESVRESNALLKEQLHLLQNQNQKLQKQLDARDKELETIHTQMKILMKQRKALDSQVSSPIKNDQSSSMWPYILLLLAGAGGAGFAYWYLRIRKTPVIDKTDLSKSIPKPIEQGSQEEEIPITHALSLPAIVISEPEHTDSLQKEQEAQEEQELNEDIEITEEASSPSVVGLLSEPTESASEAKEPKKQNKPKKKNTLSLSELILSSQGLKSAEVHVDEKPISKKQEEPVSKEENAIEVTELEKKPTPDASETALEFLTAEDSIQEVTKSQETLSSFASETGPAKKPTMAEDEFLQFEASLNQDKTSESKEPVAKSATELEPLSTENEEQVAKESTPEEQFLQFEAGLQNELSSDSKEKPAKSEVKLKQEPADIENKDAATENLTAEEEQFLQFEAGLHNELSSESTEKPAKSEAKTKQDLADIESKDAATENLTAEEEQFLQFEAGLHNKLSSESKEKPAKSEAKQKQDPADIENKDAATENLTGEEEQFLQFEAGLHNKLPSELEEKPAKSESKPVEKHEGGLDFDSPLPKQKGAKKTEQHIEDKPVEEKSGNIASKDEEFLLDLPLNVENSKSSTEEDTIEVSDDLSHFFDEDNTTKLKDENTESSNDVDTQSEPMKSNPLKSRKALDTLLDLAETYVSMEDIESAKHAIEEVLEHGTKKQKEKAQSLLNEIKDK